MTQVTDSGCSDACKDAAEDYAATQICEEPPPPPRSSASSGPGADRLSAALSGRTGVERGAGRASAGQRVMACVRRATACHTRVITHEAKDTDRLRP